MGENRILSERGKRFIDLITGDYDAHITLHTNKEMDIKFKKLQEMFKQNGMKNTPHLSSFVISISEMVAEAFFNDAVALGINPAEYTMERTEAILNAIGNADKTIKKVVKARDNAVKQIDADYTLKLQTMVSSK